MATIYDVAAAAGVSAATVSRVLNRGDASPAVAARVREAAERLHYTPSRTARSLRRRSSEVVALLIPDIENPYFTELARGVSDVLNDAGYSLVLCNTDEDADREREFLRVADSENMAGVIIAPTAGSTLEPVMSSGRPVVTVDRLSLPEVDTVTMSNLEAGRSAAEHLFGLGRHRVACVTGPSGIETALARAQGWRDATRAVTGADPDPALLRHADFRVEGGREALDSLLALPKPPDAVVAGNNLQGVGVLQAMSERGVSPAELAVAVIGALPFTTISPTAVTVVRLPSRHMGSTAARMLLERIAGDEQPARTVVLRHVLEAAALPV